MGTKKQMKRHIIKRIGVNWKTLCGLPVNIYKHHFTEPNCKRCAKATGG